MPLRKTVDTLSMKILFENCRLPSGKNSFCTEGAAFCAPLPPFDERIDLDGAFVLSAFPDAHSHLLAYALSLLQADGAHCRTAEDFVAAAEDFAAARNLENNTLVTVKNADVLPEGGAFETHPRPLHVQMRSGHAGAFNAAARNALGIADGGILEESDYISVTGRVPLPPQKDILAAFASAQQDYLAHGMTAAQEGFLSREMFELYEMLLRENALTADVIAYASPADYPEAAARFAGAFRFTVGGMKIFLDGSPQQRTAFLREPYIGGGKGMLEMDEESVLSACRAAVREGTQLLAHCNGDGAAQVFLNALARLSEQERRLIRPVLIHAQIIGKDQLMRMKELDVIPSFFPAHVLYWGDIHLKNLGDIATAFFRRFGCLGCVRTHGGKSLDHLYARNVRHTFRDEQTLVIPPTAQFRLMQRDRHNHIHAVKKTAARQFLRELPGKARSQFRAVTVFYILNQFRIFALPVITEKRDGRIHPLATDKQVGHFLHTAS